MTDCRYYTSVKAGSKACERMRASGRSLCEGCTELAAELEEVTEMKQLKCSKCGRVFKHPKRLETHEAGCTGATPSRGPRGRKGPGKAGRGAGPARKAIKANGPNDLFVAYIRREATVGELIDAYPGIEQVIINHVQEQA